MAAYSSKGALITLTELLAEEYRDRGISFNVLALGAVQTEMLEEAFPGYKAPITPGEMAAYIYDFACTGHKFYNGKVPCVQYNTLTSRFKFRECVDSFQLHPKSSNSNSKGIHSARRFFYYNKQKALDKTRRFSKVPRW